MLTSWYVSASTGASGNPGTLASPFSTIQAAANVAEPGDVVLIESGTYRETVTPANSGTSGAPITYEPYHGASVLIDGADPISGFSLYSGNIYVANTTVDLGEGNNEVFDGTTNLNEASYPTVGTNPFAPNTLSITSTNAAAATQDTQTSCTIYNASLNQAAGYWVGSTIHFSPGQQWIWETGTVTASAPGSITISYTQLTSFEVPVAGNPFYLTGQLQQLGSPGEFFVDGTAQKLYVWAPNSGAPTSVDIKTRKFGFDLSGKQYINIQGLSLHATSINTDTNSANINISSLQVYNASQQMDNAYPWGDKYLAGSTGLLINGTNITVANCTIAYTTGDGVYLGGMDNTVENCTIDNVDYAGGDEAAVDVHGTGNTVTHNLIYDTGRSGITFYFSPQTTISNNVIHDIAQLTSDAGGIYSWNTDGQGSEISENVIYNALSGGYGDTGILMDNNESNVIIDHNVVYNADNALKMNGTSTDDSVYNNTLIAAVMPPATTMPLIYPPAALIEGASPSMPGTHIENNIMMGTVMYSSGAVHTNNYTTATATDFVDYTNNNFQLAAGSGAIDEGIVIAPYTDGYVGAAPDAGAYEYGLSAFEAGPSSGAELSITPPAAQNAVQGAASPISLGSFNSAGTTSPFTVTVNWNDGTANTVFSQNLTGQITSQSHTFAATGSFTVTVSVQDAAGHKASSKTFDVTVSQAVDLPTQVVFGQQPSSELLGATIAPAITLMIEDASGNVISSATSDVTLALASGPSGATLAGTLTVPAINGVAAFTDLSLATAGQYTLVASATGLASATSNTFTITAPAPVTTPTTVTVATSAASIQQDQTLTLTATVAAAAQSSFTPTGNVSFYDGSTLLQTVALNTNLTASFVTSNLAVGVHSITVQYSGDNNFNPSTSTALTQTITSRPAISSFLVPTVIGASVPGTIVEGQKFKSKIPVVVTNSGTSAFAGTFKITVFAGLDSTFDSSDVAIFSITKQTKLKANGDRMFVVPPLPIPTTFAEGKYNLVVQVSDPSGNVSTTPLVNGIQIAAPVVALTASVGVVTPATIAAGKPGVATITLINSGNVAISSPATLDFGLSTDGSTLAVVLLSQPRHASLKPGAQMTFRLHFSTKAVPAAGSYFPGVELNFNGKTATTVGTVAVMIG